MNEKPVTISYENPFAAAAAQEVNKGTVAIEQSRAVSEAMGKLYLAKQFPRDRRAGFDRLMEACSRPRLAEVATYQYPRGDTRIEGPSIRLAEELARCWGNIDFGIRELSQGRGVSEWQAYAWDMESNVTAAKTFTVKHERHTKAGVIKLTDPRDIYEVGANAGGRRLRACILSVMPPELIDEALNQCAHTLARTLERSIPESVQLMLKAFAEYSITQTHIEERIGKGVAEFSPAVLVELRGIYQSLKDGIAKPSDFFKITDPASNKSGSAVEAVNEALATRRTARPEKGNERRT